MDLWKHGANSTPHSTPHSTHIGSAGHYRSRAHSQAKLAAGKGGTKPGQALGRGKASHDEGTAHSNAACRGQAGRMPLSVVVSIFRLQLSAAAQLCASALQRSSDAELGALLPSNSAHLYRAAARCALTGPASPAPGRRSACPARRCPLQTGQQRRHACRLSRRSNAWPFISQPNSTTTAG